MRRGNGMAIAGFVVSLSSILPLAAGFLCLINVMLNSLVGVIFGSVALLTAATGVVFSGVGHYRSYEENAHGAGLSLAGLLVGTAVITLCAAVAATLIVIAVIG